MPRVGSLDFLSTNTIILIAVAWIAAAVTGLIATYLWRRSRQKWEAENARTAERERALEASCPQAIITADGHGLIRGFNPAAERLFGYSRDEMIGQSILRLIPDADSMGHDAAVDPVSGTLKAAVEGRIKDGSRVPLTVSAGKATLGEAPLLRLFLAEESESGRVEIIVEQPPEQVVARIAQQFSDLLTAVNGYGELALHSVPGESPARADLEELLKAGDKAAQLTRDLLAYSGNQLIPIERVELNALARELSREIVDFEVTLLADPIRPVALANGERMRDALRLIVANARQRAQSSGGSLTIVTGREEVRDPRRVVTGDLAPGDYACIGIVDTGSPIAPPTLAALFDPFGALGTVYGFVRSCSGGLSVKSQEGESTVFEIRFPLATARSSEQKKARVAVNG